MNKSSWPQNVAHLLERAEQKYRKEPSHRVNLPLESLPRGLFSGETMHCLYCPNPSGSRFLRLAAKSSLGGHALLEHRHRTALVTLEGMPQVNKEVHTWPLVLN